MNNQATSRRALLKGAGKALAGLTVLRVTGPSKLLGQSTGDVIPWLDQPPANPNPANIGNLLRWEGLDSWQTPTKNFFFVSHFGQPGGLDGSSWRVEIAGMVARPRSLTLEDIKARERHEVDFTLECSGNNIVPGVFFQGGIGNARWAGARLAPLLEQSNILEEGSEVIFWGSDRGQVTIRDNTGIISGGRTGVLQPDSGGGMDLQITEQFARSMSVQDALSRDNILCYEMNGDPLPTEHGFPVRLIAPGWYGVANVKWLNRIEVRRGRYAGRFMARDYVTIREEQHGGETIWTFTTVNHDRLKSAPAKVVRTGDAYRVFGAAWGAPVRRVDVRIDDGPWRRARLHRRLGRAGASGFAWRFWTFDWGHPTPGDHAVTSRGFDEHGQVQPRPQDPAIANRRTFWENNGEITRHVTIPAR